MSHIMYDKLNQVTLPYPIKPAISQEQANTLLVKMAAELLEKHGNAMLPNLKY